jgi:hypothetical protein
VSAPRERPYPLALNRRASHECGVHYGEVPVRLLRRAVVDLVSTIGSSNAQSTENPMTSAEPRDPSEQAIARAIDAPQFAERELYILAAEHSSLASARSLAYNEAFVRIGNLLTFVSISFVALALIAQATSFREPFLGIASITLTFDFIVGLITLGRVLGTTSDDLRAVQGMACPTRLPPDRATLGGVLF